MKKILDYDCFLFDFDGVIADSVNVKTEAFCKLYKPYGSGVVRKVREHHLSHGGLDRYKKIAHYHENFLGKKLTASGVKRFAARFAGLVTGGVISSPFIGGAPTFLKLLKDKKKKMFVISATPTGELKRIIRAKGIRKFFSDIAGSPAAKEDSLKMILKKYGIKKSGSVYFGDSPEDRKIAKSCGVDFVPINYFDGTIGYKNFTEFMEAEGV